MSRSPDTLIGHILTAVGLGRTPAAEVARGLREIAGGIEAAIGTAGGTISISDDCKLPGATRRPTIKEQSNV